MTKEPRETILKWLDRIERVLPPEGSGERENLEIDHRTMQLFRELTVEQKQTVYWFAKSLRDNEKCLPTPVNSNPSGGGAADGTTDK